MWDRFYGNYENRDSYPSFDEWSQDYDFKQSPQTTTDKLTEDIYKYLESR